jgi:hypothetical protein
VSAGKVRYFLWLSAGLVSAGWIFAAVNLRSPYLLRYREAAFWIWLAAGVIALTWLLVRGRRLPPRPLQLAASAAVLGGAFAGHGHWLHFHHRRIVEETSAARMPESGNI